MHWCLSLASMNRSLPCLRSFLRWADDSKLEMKTSFNQPDKCTRNDVLGFGRRWLFACARKVHITCQNMGTGSFPKTAASGGWGGTAMTPGTLPGFLYPDREELVFHTMATATRLTDRNWQPKLFPFRFAKDSCMIPALVIVWRMHFIVWFPPPTHVTDAVLLHMRYEWDCDACN